MGSVGLVTDDDREQVKERRRQATGIQVFGLIVLAVGIGLISPWAGVTVFGIGVLLMGVAAELR